MLPFPLTPVPVGRARVLAADADGEEFEKAPGGPFPAPTISVGRCLELRTAISKFMIVAGIKRFRDAPGSRRSELWR